MSEELDGFGQPKRTLTEGELEAIRFQADCQAAQRARAVRLQLLAESVHRENELWDMLWKQFNKQIGEP